MKTARNQAIGLLKLMLVASIVLPAVLFAFAAAVSYRNFHQVADERIERSVDILHEHALKVFQTVELTFGQVDEILRGMSDDDIRGNEQRLHERLKRILRELPQLQGMAIVDRNGRALISGSLSPVRSDLDLTTRPYFEVHAKGERGTAVSAMMEPMLGGIGTPFFSVSRPRLAIDGAFNGVVTIAVLPSYFESFYARIGQSAGSYYAMIRQDGAFLARYPVPNNRNARLDANSVLLKTISSGNDRAIFTAASQVDNVDRRIGYRRLTGFPIFVMAGAELSAIEAEWYRYMAGHLIFGLPATAVLFGIIWLALRRTSRLYAEADRREAAEAALRQSQRLEAIGQLTGGVAHDFNNLLMIVGGSVQRLRPQISDAKGTRLLDMITTATQRGESLTRQLLAYSRQQMLAPQVIDLSRRLPQIRDLLMRSLGGHIEIAVDVPRELCAVKVDPGELELAMLNLAVNAKDAMPSGGTLSLRAEPVSLEGDAATDGLRGEFIAIRVSDTGSGIPADVLPRVFEPFFTTKDVGKGTGLGLSQVYGFAKQSGGTASVASVEGRGTTITLYLPRSREALSEASLEETISASPVATGSVLVVEDNPDVAEVGSAYLRQLGYTVRSVGNARAALEALKADGHVDLVFSDILMPGGMNGLDLAQEIHRRFPQMPILLTTGYSASAQDAVRQNVVVLPKPYNISALEKAIGEALSRRQPERREAAAG